MKLRATRYPTNPPAGKDSDTFYLVGMQYNINQQLWLLRLAEQDETGVTRTLAREYRYDGDGRVRYYERDRDPDDLAPIEGVEKWREFLGSSVYSDLDVIGSGDPLSSQKSRRYVHAADGQLVAWFDVPDSEHENGQWHFVHADMLGTTRLVTDDAGDVGSGLAYTAFGELAGSAFPGGPAATSRYGYCGGWGYEDDTLATLGGGSSDPVAGLGLLHVGARWYAPGLGRFVQRDPASLHGGINNYSYVGSAPTVFIDASGNEWSLGGVLTAVGFLGVLSTNMGWTLQAAASRGLVSPGWSAVGDWMVIGGEAAMLVGFGGKMLCKPRLPPPVPPSSPPPGPPMWPGV
ncbi:MAG: hypothetical protein AMXMBFR47_29290 [Planctomycetota bacterium]